MLNFQVEEKIKWELGSKKKKKLRTLEMVNI